MSEREDKTYTRREFLKIAGLTGAAVGAGASLGPILAGCGEEEASTTTAAPATTATTAAPGTTTTMAASTTTVSAGPEKGRTLKIGMVSPSTGALAPFAAADGWARQHLSESIPDGILCADGKVRVVETILKDTQSDSSRAAAITSEFIQSDKVDVVVASGAPDTTSPSADVCEAMGCPSLSSAGPWQAFYYDRNPPEDGFKWTYGFLIGSEQTILCFSEMFDQIPNNKKVGMLFPNDADAAGWMAPNAAPAVFDAKGYTLVMPDWYTPGLEDFTTQIQTFKSEGCEIVCGSNTAPDFTNFWKQCIQQGYRPKLVSTGKALLFPQTLDALGPIGNGLLGEVGWGRTFPYLDSLTGWTSEQLYQDMEAKLGSQPGPASAGMYSSLEWAVDAFKRAANPEDKQSFIDAIKTTKGQFVCGDMDMTSPIDPAGFHPCPNAYKMAFAGGQWRLTNGGKYMFELTICSAATAPGLKVDDTVQPMVY
jgi:branched-chain amino acid transport system substrate-binding protein